MKKTFRQFTGVILLGMLISTGQHLTAQHKCIDFNALKEDEIETGIFMKEYKKVKEEQRKFKDNLRFDNGSGNQVLDPSPTIINMKGMVQLFDSLPQSPCAANVRGFKVVFGLSGNKVLFFFRLVTMKPESPGTIPDDSTIRYKVAEITPTYKYIDSIARFVPVTAVDNAYISNYADYMRVRRRRISMGFSKLNQDGNEWQRDTKEVIFSFQELFNLYNTAYDCSDVNYVKDLYFYNGASNYGIRKHMRHRRKHNIFIAVEDINSLLPRSTAVLAITNKIADKAANMAHLCPPSCNPVYKIRKFHCENEKIKIGPKTKK